MNFKKHAKQLEQFLEEEFKGIVPLLKVSDTCLIYNNSKISLSDKNQWLLEKNGSTLGEFKLRTCAILASKCYAIGDYKKLLEIQSLDNLYWQAASDEKFFKYRIETTTDLIKKDIFLARFGEAKTKAAFYKGKISSLFKLSIDK